MAPALAVMDNAKLRAFFAALGVPTAAADGFHVFSGIELGTERARRAPAANGRPRRDSDHGG